MKPPLAVLSICALVTARPWPAMAEAFLTEGASWQLQADWGWSLGATLLAFLLLEVVVLGLYWRQQSTTPLLLRLGLAQLRVLAFAVLFLMLSRASLAFFRVGLPYLPILVDDSLSMTAADTYDLATADSLRRTLNLASGEPISRWRIVQGLFGPSGKGVWERLAKQYRMRAHLLERPNEGTPLEVTTLPWFQDHQPQTPRTELGSAIRRLLEAYAGSSPAALVVVTDGINTEGPGLAEAARWSRTANVPLFFIALGQEVTAPDAELRDLAVQDPVFVGDLAIFNCTLEAKRLKGQKLQVALKEEGQAQPLQTVEVVPSDDNFRQLLTLTHRPTQVGIRRFVVELTPTVEESNQDNNRLERTITVTDEKIRVLLAASGPSYEFRFLRNLLARERTVELRTHLQEADPGHSQQDSLALESFPIRREELMWFDVVILMDINPALLGRVGLESLAAAVDPPDATEETTGLSLIVVAGPRFLPGALVKTPLEKLLPVDLAPVLAPVGQSGISGAFRPRPTPAGLGFPGLQLADWPTESQAVWEHLPPLYWHAGLGPAKAGARVLLEHPDLLGPDNRPVPLVAFQYFGKGAVLIHGFDETWRWRWRVGDVFFGRYWLQTLRFLARGKLGARDKRPILSTNKREYQFGEPVSLRLVFPEGLRPPAGDTVTLLVRFGEGKPQPVTLSRSAAANGIFEGTLSRPPVGTHRIWYPDPTRPGQDVTADFRILPPTGEFSRLETDIQAMRQAAEMTGGLVLRPWEISRLPELLPRGQSLPLEALPPWPLWNSWPILLLFVILLSVEWILRKTAGMA
ncbi:MAG: hypothetical protein RMJ16_01400 [Thermoguttaceae bacterium]|nr:hypothetical protein [Thermoguttaceae bacterium]